MDGEEQLRELAASLRAAPKRLGQEIALEAAPLLQAEVRGTASAGEDPYGKAWAPTKDGKPPLEHVGSAIHAVVSGTTAAVVTLILHGHYVFHQRGVGKGKGKPDAKRGTPARQILPDPRKGELPEGMLAVIRKAAATVRERLLSGGGR